MVKHAADTLQALDPVCHKVARYLRNRAAGLSLATGELNARLQELAVTYSLGAVVLACLIWRLVFDLQNDRRPWQRTEQIGNSSGPLHAWGTCRASDTRRSWMPSRPF